MNERIQKIRKILKLNQKEFGDKLGVSRDVISNMELGRVEPKETLIKLICKEFDTSEIWLRTGEGEMFKSLPEEDEVAAYVAELLNDDGGNPIYTLIKEIMHTYSELDLKSQEVLKISCSKLIENLSKKREG